MTHPPSYKNLVICHGYIVPPPFPYLGKRVDTKYKIDKAFIIILHDPQSFGIQIREFFRPYLVKFSLTSCKTMF